jgi:crotonobetainyl-CoA:carnitine CoA-transferase CaiB-like acyl-CoA transferase
MADNGGIFSGIRVIEFSQWVAGPMMTKMMADLGADVIKLELPPAGDNMRLPIMKAGWGAGFISENRGKKSVCLDIKNAEGAELARQLIARSDVFLENFTPGVVARYGLGYERLRQTNPRLIMCSISGFGQNGPDAHRPGNDLIAQAGGGLLNLVGYPDGPPLYPGVNIGDCTGGLSAFAAVTAALLHRERAGVGQYIDIALVECLAYLNSLGMVATAMGQGTYKQHRTGAHSSGLAPFGIFKATGGYVAISVLAYQWGIFSKAIGREELGDDPRFNTPARRMENQALVIEIVENWLQSFPNREEPLAILEGAHILSTPVADTDDVINRPQTRVRGFIQDVPHPGISALGIPRTPFHFSQTPTAIPRRAPMLGEHNAAVFSELLGFPISRIDALTAAGILVEEPRVAELRATGEID